MRLSIITINKNNASGLEKTIRSVISQSFKDFEYIVVDGDSTDGSKEIIARYRDVINITISEPDTGIYNAMNKGAKHAHGEYLLFLNSGDTLYSDAVIEDVLNYGLSTDLASGNCYNYSKKEDFFEIPPTNLSLYTFIDGSLPHPSSFIKKELFNKIGGYHEEFKIISDWCFFIEATLLHNCSYSVIPITVASFNLYGISSTSPYLEHSLSHDFLKDKFGRIMNDYLPLEDEALSNCMYYISTRNGMQKKLIMFPFKVLNCILKLRIKLSKRVGVVKQY